MHAHWHLMRGVSLEIYLHTCLVDTSCMCLWYVAFVCDMIVAYGCHAAYMSFILHVYAVVFIFAQVS